MQKALHAEGTAPIAEDNSRHILHPHRAAVTGDQPVLDPGSPARLRQHAKLVGHVQRLWDAEPEELDDFFRYGMWLNVAAAMGVEELSAGCHWMQLEQESGGEA